MQMLLLAGPALLSGCLGPMEEMLQTAAVGRMLGTEALAALGVASAVFLFVLKVFNFLDTATTARVARALATSPSAAAASPVVAHALWTAALIGSVIAAGSLCCAPALLRLMGSSEVLVPHVLPYIRLRGIGAPLELMTMASNGAFRGCGDTVTPATTSLISAALGVGVGLGSLVLLRPAVEAVSDDSGGDGTTALAAPALGLMGLALGRLVASAASLAWSIAALRRTGTLRWADLAAPPPPEARAGFASSAGALFVRTMCLKLFMTSLSLAAARLTPAAAAAHAVLRQTAQLFSLALDSCAVAAQALIARHLSEGAPQCARRAAWAAHRAALLLALLLAVLLWGCETKFAALFSTDPEVLAQLARGLRLLGPLQLLGAPAYVYDGAFLGAGDFGFMARSMVAAVAAGAAALHLTTSDQLGQLAVEGLDRLWLAWGALMAVRVAAFTWRFLLDPAGPFPAAMAMAPPPLPPPPVCASRSRSRSGSAGAAASRSDAGGGSESEGSETGRSERSSRSRRRRHVGRKSASPSMKQRGGGGHVKVAQQP